MKPFIYDVKTSEFFSPDGEYLKTIFCPKAIKLDQLIADDPTDRSRGCSACKQRVLNLDANETRDVVALIKKNQNTCIFASPNSPRVTRLQSREDFYSNIRDKKDTANPNQYLEIRVCTNHEDLFRTRIKKYWADVQHVVNVLDKSGKPTYLAQETDTGGFLSLNAEDLQNHTLNDKLKILQPAKFLNQIYANEFIVAYLIPPDTAEGTKVYIKNPIDLDDGSTHLTRSDHPFDATGTIKNKKVVLDKNSIKWGYFTMG